MRPNMSAAQPATPRIFFCIICSLVDFLQSLWKTFTKQSLHYFFEKVKFCLQKIIPSWNNISFLRQFSYKKNTISKGKFLVIFGEIWAIWAIFDFQDWEQKNVLTVYFYKGKILFTNGIFVRFSRFFCFFRELTGSFASLRTTRRRFPLKAGMTRYSVTHYRSSQRFPLGGGNDIITAGMTIPR